MIQPSPNSSSHIRQHTSIDHVEGFLADLRHRYLEQNKKLNGVNPADEKAEEYRQKIVSRNRHIQALQSREIDIIEPSLRLLRQFDLLLNRERIGPIEASFRLELHNYLLNGLAANTNFYNFKPTVLVTATLFSDIPLSELPNLEVSRPIKDKMWVFYRAFTSSPQHVLRFLQNGANRLGEMIELCRDMYLPLNSTVRIRYAYMHQNIPVQEILKRQQTITEQIINDKELEQIVRASRSLVSIVLSEHSHAKAHETLRGLAKTFQSLITDPELAVFKSRPGDLLYGLYHHPREPKLFLLNTLKREQELGALLGEHESLCSPDKLRKLCLKRPRKAEQLIEFYQNERDKD
jgi:hypothetical protein